MDIEHLEVVARDPESTEDQDPNDPEKLYM